MPSWCGKYFGGARRVRTRQSEPDQQGRTWAGWGMDRDGWRAVGRRVEGALQEVDPREMVRPEKGVLGLAQGRHSRWDTGAWAGRAGRASGSLRKAGLGTGETGDASGSS